MQTVAQPGYLAVKATKPLAEVGTAQHTALLRWFSRAPLHAVVGALQANPHFPLVSCNTHAHSFAPARGTPRPAA